MRRCVLALAVLLVPASSHARPPIHGTRGPDRLLGTPAADKIIADRGDDRVDGGGGRDYLNGGPDADILNGGPDADYFEWYLKPPGVAFGRDLIEDFEKGSDRIIFEAVLRDGHVCGFDGLDTNGSGVLEPGDRHVRIVPLNVGGATRPSTVIDVTPHAGVGGEQSLSIHGVVGLNARDFACDPDLPVP
jgi:hypothetical protein